MCFNCCRRAQNCGLDLDSSLTARRKIELMARWSVIHERAACELIECISTYASTVFIRFFTQSARISAITGSVVLTGDLSAGLQISDAKYDECSFSTTRSRCSVAVRQYLRSRMPGFASIMIFWMRSLYAWIVFGAIWE